MRGVLASLMIFAATAMPIAGQLGRPGGLAGVDGAEGAAATKTGPIPRRPDGHPDLSGTFNGSPGGVTHTVILEEHPGGFGVLGGHTLIIDPPDGIIPYQPWALEERNRRRDDANGYEDQVGHCEFYDVGRIHSFTQEYRFSGNNFIINATQHITRIVPMDRKDHLPPGIRLWLGDPIGHWEGDTLVVDTVGFNEKFWMDRRGSPHTEKLHFIERFTRPDHDTLKYQVTVDDPGAYTATWSSDSFSMTWNPDQELFEYVCQQSNYAHELMVGTLGTVSRSEVIVP